MVLAYIYSPINECVIFHTEEMQVEGAGLHGKDAKMEHKGHNNLLLKAIWSISRGILESRNSVSWRHLVRLWSCVSVRETSGRRWCSLEIGNAEWEFYPRFGRATASGSMWRLEQQLLRLLGVGCGRLGCRSDDPIDWTGVDSGGSCMGAEFTVGLVFLMFGASRALKN
jgi:hypothetical protein